MKDHLLDLVGHTLDLGCINLVKIRGDEEKTSIMAIADDGSSVVVMGEFNGPVAEFVGTFGMPNLSKLKILLNLDEYRENAQLTINRKDTGAPECLNFTNAAGDFCNSYRFMAENIVNGTLKDARFKGASWSVEFEPTVAAIQRLKWQAAANAEENLFQVKVENGDLKFFLGDHSNHTGNFVFHPGVKGTFKRTWSYPVKAITNILDLVGDKTFRISDDGVAQITVDSGLAVYNYIICAQSK
jgi:hypothetical protein